VLNPLDRSLKPEYRLNDNSSFMSFYDLNINPSDTNRKYVTFWNPSTNTNINGQITRKHLHIETADIRHFNLISNNMELESLVKCPGCSLNVSNIIDLHRNGDLKSLTRQAKVH
ncbi:2193_t:CDS:2, partial [Funneliformis geosporum]